ncbi:MAG: hypothetical protein KKC68_04180 [Candidatus Thermoplasmatota archaeon]|nr:hypothetical protein [Candidatus Thermoplasmatota archaeon]MBU1940949.1 hypothetical protein [Candidatus Thermoplasmatota archaeon]
MSSEYYPWGGDFEACEPKGCIAVVLLTTSYIPPDSVAIYGSLRTENIGIEKIIANVISNPHIRYLMICGDEIRGHRSGSSLVALHAHGIDDNHRIINAPGAIPYIENIDQAAINRFQQQIEILDYIGCSNATTLNRMITHYIDKTPTAFGNPHYAIRICPEKNLSLDDSRALHSKIQIDYMGKIQKRGG